MIVLHPAINSLLDSSPASILVWWNYTETAICSCYGMAPEDAPVSNSGSLKKKCKYERRLLLIALICSLCNCFLDMASCCLLNDACQKGFGLRLRPKILGSCSLWENFSLKKRLAIFNWSIVSCGDGSVCELFFAPGKSLIHNIFIVLLPTPLWIFQSFQSSINVFHYNSLLMPNPYPNKPFYVKKTQSLCFWFAEDN